MTADDFRQLSTQYQNGKNYLVISSGSAQLVGTREEANALVRANAPAVAFRVNDLTSGDYVERDRVSSPVKESSYRKIGQPYQGLF